MVMPSVDGEIEESIERVINAIAQKVRRNETKIEIIGHRVHDVGYRYFLMNQALLQGIDGFTALNQIDNSF